MSSDEIYDFPLMDSGLIGFRAPHNPKYDRLLSDRTLGYISVWEEELRKSSIQVHCDKNIWSSNFRSEHEHLYPFVVPSVPKTISAMVYDWSENSLDSDSSVESWDRRKFSTISTRTTDSWNKSKVQSFTSFTSISLNDGYTSDDEEEEDEVYQLSAPNQSAFRLQVSPKAKFFVIKSYNASDVLTSIKQKIWASTDLGNKRLDKAYKDSDGEVFLFFSVNGSAKFCGVARMQGVVDFSTSSNAWAEASRWKGIFSVSWITYREISNKAFRHLRVSTNENKPVSNSRDTQELPAAIGKSMLAIFSVALV